MEERKGRRQEGEFSCRNVQRKANRRSLRWCDVLVGGGEGVLNGSQRGDPTDECMRLLAPPPSWSYMQICCRSMAACSGGDGLSVK